MLDVLISDIIEIAPELRRKDVWLVGGAVRDAKVGVRPKDYDFVVEGDAIGLVKTLVAVDRNATLTASYPQFGVASIEYYERRWDFASARTETYSKPGKLPTVRLGATIKEDLERRDFTVNTFAVNLKTGTQQHASAALVDLANRQLRVLHPFSFQEDPTRMLRALRYCGQGYTLHPDTRAMINFDLLDTVSTPRILKEFP